MDLLIHLELLIIMQGCRICGEENRDHAIIPSSYKFKCRLDLLRRDSSCLMKLSITLLRSEVVIPVLSSTIGNNIITILVAPIFELALSGMPLAWDTGE
ncbi:hypothetical protein VNO77_34218 [Canavalia gladiata]|uniref:Uncharacterized protein n=1 Tax=Canavalia gladiata TaxID=3824 RepID=A0AAN9KGC2_CANGL